MIRIVFAGLLVALIPLETNAADGNDCLYNQDAFVEMYAPIKQEYKDTRFLKKDQSLEIKLDDSKVIVRYFGCEHYGTEINYFENKHEVYSDNEIFEKSIDLIKRFGQDRIDGGVLRSLLNSGKYEKFENRMFTVNYPGMDEFSITVDTQKGKPLIEIGFYN